jgi:hypothetical protein
MAAMKLSETINVLAAYATELNWLGATAQAGWLAELTNCLDAVREKPMARLIEKCRSPIAAAGSTSSKKMLPTGADVAKVIAGVATVLRQAKENRYSKDLLLLAQLIDSESVYLETILQILKQTMMPATSDLDTIASKLKAAVGTDQFESLYAELAASTVDKAGLAYIARAVYGDKPKGASKAAALQTIRKLHEVSIRTRRNLEAQGGRSAA